MTRDTYEMMYEDGEMKMCSKSKRKTVDQVEYEEISYLILYNNIRYTITTNSGRHLSASKLNIMSLK